MSLKVRAYVWLSWLLFIGGMIGWPVSQLTWAKGEPPFILGLSWLAIIVTGYGNVIMADVRKEQDNNKS